MIFIVLNTYAIWLINSVSDRYLLKATVISILHRIAISFANCVSTFDYFAHWNLLDCTFLDWAPEWCTAQSSFFRPLSSTDEIGCVAGTRPSDFNVARLVVATAPSYAPRLSQRRFAWGHFIRYSFLSGFTGDIRIMRIGMDWVSAAAKIIASKDVLCCSGSNRRF